MNFLKFKPLPLAIFSFSDVMLFNIEYTLLQVVCAIAAYCFVLLAFSNNQKDGILYFFSFNILAIGVGNYWGAEDAIYSYWGLRCGPFSFNILFSLVLVICVSRKVRLKQLFSSDPYTKFFIVFIIWCFVIGVFSTVLGYNYVDNFKTDILIFFPIVFYIILSRFLTLYDLTCLLKYIIPLTVYSLVIAFILGKKTSYSQETFLVCNVFANIAPIGVIILRNYFSIKKQLVYLLVYLCLLLTMSILVGGKLIISYLFLLVWWASLNKRWRYMNLLLLFGGMPLILLSLNYLSKSATSGIIAFKLSQVASLIDNPDFLEMALEYSSIGNLIAEAITLINYLCHHLMFFIFGKGFGAGIPDLFGFLTPFAGAAGYSEIDGVRNDFFNLHIAPYKILIDGGIIMFIYYIKILWSLLTQKTAVSFLAFLMMVMYFYVSKELLLLTYILTRICAYESKCSKIELASSPI